MSIENIKAQHTATVRNNAERTGLKSPEFVRNFNFARNNSIDITSNDVPTLTLKNENEEQAIHLRWDKHNIPQVRNGAIYNAIIDSDIFEKHSNNFIPAGEASIKDGALSFGLNRFRVTGPENTETQKILTKLQNIKNPDERMTELTKLVNTEHTQSLDRSMRLKMVNDPVRRAFEMLLCEIRFARSL